MQSKTRLMAVSVQSECGRKTVSQKDWREEPFADCFEPLRNNTYSRAVMTPTAGIANIHYGDVLVKYGEVLDFSTADVPSLLPGTTAVGDELRDGDIVIADTAEDETCGRTVEIANLGSRKAVAGLHTIACRPKPGLFVPGWLGYFMNSVSYHRQLVPLMAGIKVLSISRTALKGTTILIPPISKQRQIVAVFLECDRVVEGKQKLLDSKKQQKRALMRMLLETNSGDVPDGRIKRTQWQARKLGKLGYFVSGTGFPLSYQGCSTGDFPFFKVSDMNRIGNETFLEKTDNWISDATRKSLSAIAIPQDAIAFAKVGAACLLERKRRLARASCLDNNMMAFVLESKDIDPAFMHLAFCSIRLSSSANLGTLPSINAGSLKERVVMVPPKSTQERIVAVLSAADREIDGLAREIEAWKQKRKALSQLLLSGKVRV